MGLFPETPKSVLRRIADLRDGMDESAWECFAELYEPAKGKFRTYLSTIVRRILIDRARRLVVRFSSARAPTR